jgi:hypothetical protein
MMMTLIGSPPPGPPYRSHLLATADELAGRQRAIRKMHTERQVYPWPVAPAKPVVDYLAITRAVAHSAW